MRSWRVQGCSGHLVRDAIRNIVLNHNDSHLPNQLEGRDVKGQIQGMGLTEVSKRNVNVFESSFDVRWFVRKQLACLVHHRLWSPDPTSGCTERAMSIALFQFSSDRSQYQKGDLADGIGQKPDEVASEAVSGLSSGILVIREVMS